MTIFVGQNEPEATRRLVYFWLVQSNGTSVATNEATNRPQWSLNGSAYTAATNTLSAVSANAGQYSLQLSQSETSLLGLMRFRHSSTTCFEQSTDGGPAQIVPNNPYNPQYLSQQSKLQAGGTTSAISFGSGETTKDGWYNGSFVLLQYPNGDLVGNIVSIYTGSNKQAQLQNALPTAPTSSVTYFLYPGTSATPIGDMWNAATSSYSTTGTFGAVINWETGSAQSGRVSGISLAASASAVNDYYNNSIIRIVKGTGAGQSRIISDYTGATKSAEVNGNWATTPDSTSEYAISPLGAIPGASAPTAAQNATAIWEYSSGRTVDSVGTLTNFASTLSAALKPGTYSGVTIDGVTQLTSGVTLLAGRTYSDVTVRLGGIAAATYSGVTFGVNNIAAGSYSGVTIAGVTEVTSGVTLTAGRTYSDVTVRAGALATIVTTGRTEIAQSICSLDLGQGSVRLLQEYLWPLRNRVQTDPAASVGTVFKPDDTTSSWTFGLSTSTLAITGFDPGGP